MDEQMQLTREAAAKELGITPRVLADLAKAKKGPPYYRITNRTLLYPHDDLLRWKNDQLRMARATPQA